MRFARSIKFATRLLRPTLGVYLKLRFNTVARNVDAINDIDGPILVLANHVGFWDPFLAGSVAGRPIRYVAADANFRSPILGAVLRFVGTIAKSKGVSDFEAIKTLMRARDDGWALGIFPEGERTWDGTPCGVIFSTAKLVRLLRIPVVAAVFEGGYLSHPRWARTIRRGKLIVRFSRIITAEQTRSLTPEQIHGRITEALDHDDTDAALLRRRRFHGRRLADGIERVLYRCAACGTYGSIRSKADRFACTECDATWRYSQHGLFEQTGLGTRGDQPAIGRNVSTVRDWNAWQKDELAQQIDGAAPDEIIVTVRARHFTGYRRRRMRAGGAGVLTVRRDRIEYTPDAGSTVLLPLHEVSGVGVVYTTWLELYHQGVLHVFRPTRRTASAYLVQTAIREALRRTAEK